MFSKSIYFFINVCLIGAYDSFDFLQNIKSQNHNLRIINGREAIPHALGYQVAIKIGLTNGYITLCGGSLITPSYVLTAAHCFESADSLEVILGAHNISKNEWTQVHEIPTNYSIHPEWNPKLLINDIALIKLPQPVKTEFFVIRTIKLPKNDNTDYAGSQGLLSGWGQTVFNGSMSDVLEYAFSDIMSNENCKKTQPFDKVIQDTHLCLSGRGQISSCQGDSGGPLVVNGVQVGIVSFSLKYCNLTTPSVFTRVSKYLRWIGENSDLYNYY